MKLEYGPGKEAPPKFRVDAFRTTATPEQLRKAAAFLALVGPPGDLQHVGGLLQFIASGMQAVTGE